MASIKLPIDPRILDPRLVLRAFEDLHTLSQVAVAALDDLHTVAEVARGLEEVEARLTARIASAEAVLEEAVGIARGLLAIDDRAGEVLESVQVLNAAATKLAAAAEPLAAAVEPLQGATERLGRIADRLPGGGSGGGLGLGRRGRPAT